MTDMSIVSRLNEVVGPANVLSDANDRAALAKYESLLDVDSGVSGTRAMEVVRRT